MLGLYRTNKLHLAAGVCVQVKFTWCTFSTVKKEYVDCAQDFCEELEYWGLDDLHMVGSLFTIIVTIIMVIGIIVIVT